VDVKYVKLVTGENVIGQVRQETEYYLLKDAMLVAITPDGSIGMMPLSTLGKNDNVKIDKQHVVFVDDPDDEIKNIYNTKFGTGIVAATGFQIANPQL